MESYIAWEFARNITVLIYNCNIPTDVLGVGHSFSHLIVLNLKQGNFGMLVSVYLICLLFWQSFSFEAWRISPTPAYLYKGICLSDSICEVGTKTH